MEIPCRDWTIHLSQESMPWHAGENAKLQAVRIRCVPDPALTGRGMLGMERTFLANDDPQYVLWALSEAFKLVAEALERRSWDGEHSMPAVNPAEEAGPRNEDVPPRGKAAELLAAAGYGEDDEPEACAGSG